MKIVIDNMTESQVLDALIKVCDETNGEFDVELPCTGEIAHVKKFVVAENDEWFFVSGLVDPYADDESLERLARYFANYAGVIAQRNKNIQYLEEIKSQLAAIEDKDSYQYGELYCFFSDLHKDLYGRRPRYIV